MYSSFRKMSVPLLPIRDFIKHRYRKKYFSFVVTIYKDQKLIGKTVLNPYFTVSLLSLI